MRNDRTNQGNQSTIRLFQTLICVVTISTSVVFIFTYLIIYLSIGSLPLNARFVIVDHDQIFTMGKRDTAVKLLVKNTGSAKWQGDDFSLEVSSVTVLDKDDMPTANTISLASRREAGVEPGQNWFKEFRVRIPEKALPNHEFYIQMRKGKVPFGERFTVRVRRFTEEDL